MSQKCLLWSMSYGLCPSNICLYSNCLIFYKSDIANSCLCVRASHMAGGPNHDLMAAISIAVSTLLSASVVL